MKIFISMPMKSKSTEQVRVEMDKVFNYIKRKLPQVELVDSVIDEADSEIAQKGDSSGLWYLGESLKMLASADIVFFAKGYEDARGCVIERMAAESYNKFCVNITEKV